MATGVLSLLLVIVFVDVSHGLSNGSYEHVLRELMLNNYDKIVLPQDRKANNTAVTVEFGLKLNRLVKVNNKEETFVVETWVIMKWNNSFFGWDKTKYGGTDKIHFEPTEIWFPDVSLYNNADPKNPRAGGPTVFTSNVLVHDTGLCTWSGPATFTAGCSMTLNAWPFDNQSCDLKFGSFIYGTHQLRLTSFKTKSSRGDAFQENGNWNLNSDLGVKIRQADFGNCCPYKFSEITFIIKMDRRFDYHLFYLVAPCIAMALLTVIGFIIPSDSGERIGFTTTLLLGMMVFLLVVPQSLPESSKSIPVLGILMMTTMVMIGFALLGTIFVLRCHHATGTPPNYLRCLMKRSKKKRTAPESNFVKNPNAPVHEIEIKVINPDDHIHDPPKAEDNDFTWQVVAARLDAIFFWVFLVTCIVLYAVCLTFRL